MRTKNRFFYLLLITLLFLSCGKQKLERVIFVLFDISGSTKTEAVRNRYYQEFQKIVNNLQPDDLIISDNITDSPLAHSSFFINQELPSFNPLADNKIKYDKQIADEKDSILTLAKSFIFNFNKKVLLTKIAEATQLAERVFSKYADREKRLVLFSDMVEESERYNFRRTDLSPPKIQRIIEDFRAQGALPQLTGVQVYVVGAMSGSYEKFNSKKISQIRDFWTKYFEACGAELKKENYGGALLGWR